jgi:hypothetical protein
MIRHQGPEVRVRFSKPELGFLTSLTSVRGRSSAGRAPALQAGGHRFDPVRLHHPTLLRALAGRPLLSEATKAWV